MFKKKSQHDSHAKNDSIPHITLQPIAGITPRVYIPLIYLFILLIIFGTVIYTRTFIHKGEYIKIKSVPDTVAVYIDEKYIGTTPIKKFLEPGQHHIRISMPFYESHETTHISPNIVFLRRIRAVTIETLLSPLPSNMEYVPDVTQPESSLVSHTIFQLASWNTSNTHTARIQRNPILKNTIDSLHQVHRALQNDNTRQDASLDTIYDTFYQILYDSLPYIATATLDAAPTEEFQLIANTYTTLMQEEGFADLFHDEGEMYQPLPVIKNDQFYQPGNSTARNIWDISQRNPSLDDNAQERILIQQLSFSKVLSRTLYYHTQEISDAAPTDPIQSYMEIAENNREPDDTHAVVLRVNVPSFYILRREITQGDFARFLAATNTDITTWKAQHAALVSPDYQADYFKDYNPTLYSSRPLRYITWYDAYYFTQWFDNQVREQGYFAQLPNEYHWRAAVLQYPQPGVYNQDMDYIPQTASNVPSLLGSLWEWGYSWYSPSPQYAGLYGPRYGSEKHIFGGSYITKQEDMLETTPVYLTRNASQPQHWATPYVGFRIILHPLK